MICGSSLSKGKSRETKSSMSVSACFETQGIQVDSPAVELAYREFLNEGHKLLDNSDEILAELAQHFDLYVVTNGVSETQYRRLKMPN